MAAKGKWAQGIPPRNFAWIMKDRLAVSERPGGYGANHRRVRRQEEIIWVREQGFTCVISIIPAPHNLHNYDELGVTWRHRGFDNADEPEGYLSRLYPELQKLLADGEKVLLHADSLGDAVCGILTGYLVWTGLVPQGPEAVTLMERMVKRQLGPYGRDLVQTAAELPGAAPAARASFAAAKQPRRRTQGGNGATGKGDAGAKRTGTKAAAKKTAAKDTKSVTSSAKKTAAKKTSTSAKKAAAKKTSTSAKKKSVATKKKSTSPAKRATKAAKPRKSPAKS